MALTIRKASLADVPVIISLANEIWPVCFDGVIEPEMIKDLLENIYSTKGITEEIAKLGHIFWIASDDGSDVGYISAYVDGGTLWIKKLYIKPQMHGRGIATKLIDKALAEFPETIEMALYVNRNNFSAQNFYKHIGMSILREEPVKMGKREFVDIVMGKKLCF